MFQTAAMSITDQVSNQLQQKQVQAIMSACQLTAPYFTDDWQTVAQYACEHYPHEFDLHLALYQAIYADAKQRVHPAWLPSLTEIKQTHLYQLQQHLALDSIEATLAWGCAHRTAYWQYAIEQIGILFDEPYACIADQLDGPEHAKWLVGAKLNIAANCFRQSGDKAAIISQTQTGQMVAISYAELNQRSNAIAHSLVQAGFKVHDRIGIAMQMTIDAVAIFLGIIKAGMCVVGIADSYSSSQVKQRLKIAKVKAIFIHDVIHYQSKCLSLYDKLIDEQSIPAIIIHNEQVDSIAIRRQDKYFTDFLQDHVVDFAPVSMPGDSMAHILFSSGTTGEPKAIPWSHITPIKCAADAYFHHDIHTDDILCWPTSLGWMMGPWLIYASLLNGATMALYPQAATDASFGAFVESARVTMLGVVPSLVRHWRTSHCMLAYDFSCIKCFSSTGECSNPEDMLYLMSLAQYKPVIEYCGGTEIGGGYITSTLAQPNTPSVFTTAAMGLDFAVHPTADKLPFTGEAYIIPPSIGLSDQLLNRDHHATYFELSFKPVGESIWRKHGDMITKIDSHAYQLQGRNDDTMNLGGIKVSSAEIERCLMQLDAIIECAAISIKPQQAGPEQLVLLAICTDETDRASVKASCQQQIRQQLNPLFRLSELYMVTSLPKTASNKISRKACRKLYWQDFQNK